MKKKSIFFTLFVFMLGFCGSLGFFNVYSQASAVGISASVWDGETPSTITGNIDWYNEGANYYIRSAKGFAYFANLVNNENGANPFLNKNVYLETDIDLNEKAWTPIGEKFAFQGNFYGQGHVVYNLKIESSDNSKNYNYGLFGIVNTSGAIQDIHIKNANISVTENLNNVAIGGLVGKLENGKVVNSTFEGKITTENSSNQIHVGGLVGVVSSNASNTIYRSKSNAEITINLNESNVSVENNIGGLVGTSNSTSVMSIVECCADGSVKIQQKTGSSNGKQIPHLGGLIGNSTYLKVSNCFSKVDFTVNAEVQNLGGLVGRSENSLTVESSYNAGDVFGEVAGVKVGNSLVDYCTSSSTISNSFNIGKNYKGLVNGNPQIDKVYDFTPAESLKCKSKSFFQNEKYWNINAWNFDSVWNISISINEGLPYLFYAGNSEVGNNESSSEWKGEGTEESPYLIETAGDLGKMSYYDFDQNPGKYFALQNNIDLSGRNWIPIGQKTGYFSGVFDGNGYSISGMTCSIIDEYDYYALFFKTKKAVIKNLKVENTFFLGNSTQNANTKKALIVGKVEADTYIVNCVTPQSNGINAVAEVDKLALTIVWGKSNANISGIVIRSSLTLGDLSYNQGYLVEIFGKGGLVYDSQMNDFIYKNYYMALNSDGSVNSDITNIDSSFQSNFLESSEKLGDAETNIIIKEGFKLQGFKNVSNNWSVTFGEGKVEDFNNNVLGFYANWEKAVFTIDVVYNKYEKTHFGATGNDITKTFEFEYDSKISGDIFKTPAGMRKGFVLEGLYKDSDFNTENKIAIDEILNTNFATELNQSSSSSLTTIKTTVYAKWKGLDSKDGNVLSINFSKASDVSGNFNYEDAIKSITILGGSSTSENIIGAFGTEENNFSHWEVDDKGTFSQAFSYNTLYSDMTNNYIQIKLELNEGYRVSGSIGIEGREIDKRFGVITTGKNEKTQANGISAEEIDKIQMDNLSDAKFLNFVGEYAINIELARSWYEKDIQVSENVLFAIGPNIENSNFEDYEILYKGNYVSVASLSWTKKSSSLNSAETNFLLGLDLKNKVLISNHSNYDSVDITDYISNNELKIRYNESRYFTYCISEASQFEYTLNETNANYQTIDQLVVYSNEKIAYYSKSSFAFIVSTQEDTLLITNLTILNTEDYAKTDYILTNESEIEIKPSKVQMTFKNLYVIEGKALEIITAYTQAILHYYLVDNSDIKENISEINSIVSSKSPTYSSKATVDVQSAESIKVTINSSNFYHFDSKYIVDNNSSAANDIRFFGPNVDEPNVRFYANSISYSDPDSDAGWIEDFNENNGIFSGATIVNSKENGQDIEGQYDLTFNYNTSDLKPGSYNVYLSFKKIDYTLNQNVRYISDTKKDTTFYEQQGEGLPTVSTKFVNEEGSEVIENAETLEGFRYDSRLEIETSLKSNNAYIFYGWYVESIYGKSYIKNNNDEVWNIADLSYEYFKLYQMPQTSSEESSEKYITTISAVYIRKSATISMSAFITFQDLDNRVASVSEQVQLSFQQKDADGNVIFDSARSSLTYVYDINNKEKDLKNFNLVLGGLNSKALYVSGLKIENNAGETISEFDLTSSTSESGESFDLGELIFRQLESINTSVKEQYFIVPILTKKQVNLTFYSGTGKENSVGDNKNGIVFNNLNQETTNSVVKIVSNYNKIIYLNQDMSLEIVEGQQSTTKSTAVNNWFARRKGYATPSFYYWNWKDSALNAGNIFGSTLIIDKEYFNVSEYSETTGVWFSNIVFYKNWNASNFNIVFDSNGGKFAQSYTQTNTIVYDTPLQNLTVSSILPTRTGYQLEGWYVLHEGEQIDIFSTSGICEDSKDKAMEIGLIDESWNYIFEGQTTLYAKWTPKSYKIKVVYNGANSLNGQNIDLNQQLDFYKEYTIIYDTSFETLYENFGLDSQSSMKLSQLIPIREGYNFVGFYIINGNNQTLISDETDFNQNLTTANLYQEFVVTLYAKWQFDSSSISFSVDNKNFDNLTYNGKMQTVYVAELFDAENFSATGLRIIKNNLKVEFSLPESMHAEVLASITSTGPTASSENMSFEVYEKGYYTVVLSLRVSDLSRYLNLNQVYFSSTTFSIQVGLADVETIIVDGLTGQNVGVYLQNVKKVMMPFVVSDLKSQLQSCQTFSQFVNMIKTIDETAKEGSDKDIYDFVMVKYYLLSSSNLPNRHLQYRNWKYQDFVEYKSTNASTVENILSITYFVDFYDYTFTETVKQIQTYDDCIMLNSLAVSNLNNDIMIDKIVINSSFQFSAKSSYNLRAYIKNVRANALQNYQISYDGELAYINLGNIYLLAQPIEIENLEDVKYAYYNPSVTNVFVEWEGNRTKIEIEGNTFYQIAENLYAKAELYTSNGGKYDVDTEYTYDNEENYLYFDKVNILHRTIRSGEYVYQDVSNSFKFLMNENQVFTILNTIGLIDLTVSAKYLTTTNGALDFKDIKNEASQLLRITSVTYDYNGETFTEYNANGLEVGVFSKNGSSVYQIFANNDNEISIFLTQMAVSITVISTTQRIGTTIGLYKWTTYTIYNIDGTMDTAGSLQINLKDFESSETGINEINYFAVYTDLVKVNYDLSFPSDFETTSSTSSILKLGEDTEDQIVLPSEYGFQLASLQVQLTNGNWVDFKEMFTGQGLGNKKTFVGLSVQNPFLQVNLRAKWNIQDLIYSQRLFLQNWAVENFIGLDFQDVISFYNFNSELFDYAYQWFKDDVLVCNESKLTLASSGKFDESGTYKLKIIATVKEKFETALYNSTDKERDLEVLIDLNFVRHEITEVVVNCDNPIVEYDNLNHINEWYFSIKYMMYDAFTGENVVEQTTDQFFSTNKKLYFDIFFNGGGQPVLQMINAGKYSINLRADANIFVFDESFDLNDASFDFEITPFEYNLENLDVNLSKYFNGIETPLTKDASLANEIVTLSFSRTEGEDVGSYDLFFKDLSKEFKDNYIFKFGDVVVYENGSLTSVGQTTSVGTFSILKSGVLQLSYSTTYFPEEIIVPYNASGYSFKISNSFNLQIYNGVSLYREIALNLVDSMTGAEITSQTILNLIREKLYDLSFAFYDSTQLSEKVFDSGSYTYAISMGSEFSKYYSSVSFDNSFKFVVAKIAINIEEDVFNKVYDGKSTNYFKLDLSVIEDLSTYSGVYLSAHYSSAHSGQNIKVSVNVFNKDSDANISNYQLSSNSFIATISKLQATMNISLTNETYSYGEVSVAQINKLVSGFEVVGNDGQIKTDLLVSGYYEIYYKLSNSAKTNKNGFVYVGEYQLMADFDFDDFDMNVVLPKFKIEAMQLNRVLPKGFVTITALDTLQEAYLEEFVVEETGDLIVLNYRPTGLSGPTVSVGTYNLELVYETVFDNNINVTLNDNNQGFVVLFATDTIYMKFEESLLNKVYNGSVYQLVISKEAKTLTITNEKMSSETVEFEFYKKSENGEERVEKDNITFTDLQIVNSANSSSFKSSGKYRLSLIAKANEYLNIVFYTEYNFVISALSIDTSNLTIEKDYDANSNLIIENFNEKVSGDDISILAKFETAVADTEKVATLYTQGTSSGNYVLSNTQVMGKINRADAVLEITNTSLMYGHITQRNEISYTVRTSEGSVLSSQYQVTLSIENPVYSGAYLAVGNYVVKMDSYSSQNYFIKFNETSISILPFEINVIAKTNGEVNFGYGDAETKTNQFEYAFATPLLETIYLTVTRNPGVEVGYYRGVSAVSENKNYKIMSFVDESSEGMFRISRAKQTLYLLATDALSVSGASSIGTDFAFEYDSNLYDSAKIEARGVGVYNLVVYNSANSSISKSFELNYYTYDNSTNVYTLSQSSLVENLTSNLKFLNASTVKNVGRYEIYASGTSANNHEVRLGKFNAEFCFYLNIEKRNLYFKEIVQTKTFDNNEAVFTFEDASEILEGVVNSETLTLDMVFKKDNEVVKYVGSTYDIEAVVGGQTVSNYQLNMTTSLKEAISGAIVRAEVKFVVNSQTSIYGEEIVPKYSYITAVDLSKYDMNRFNASLEIIDSEDKYSTSGALKVGEYSMLLVFNSPDFYLSGYICDEVENENITSRFVVERKLLTLSEKNQTLQSVFSKKYDGTNIVAIRDVDNNLLFNIIGINQSEENVPDAVDVLSANYVSENVGNGIKVEFLLSGQDADNYQIESWAMGEILAIQVALNFNYNAEGSNVISNVETNGLSILSKLSFPFLTTTSLTANSADANTNNLKNFPTALTGKSGHTFAYWTMDFENVVNNSDELATLQNLTTLLKLQTTYENNIFSVKVDNDEKTVSLLNKLIEDSQDLFGLYFKTNEEISITFNANWNTNKYSITIQIADESGKSAPYGIVEVDDNNPDTENPTVEENFLQTYNYDSSLVLKAKAKANCFFQGFYSETGKLYNGSEEYISLSKDGDFNVLTISNIRKEYAFVVRYTVQQINLAIDLRGLDASISSENFIDDGTGRYVWKTDYLKLDNMFVSELPEIERVGYDLISISSSNAIVRANNFQTTKVSAFVSSSNQQIIDVDLTPNFEAVGVAVVLDYDYDNYRKTISVPFGKEYNYSSEWEEQPQRLGYEFLGWYDKDENKVEGTNIIQGVEEHTLTAKWKLQQFVLKLNATNVSIVDSNVNFIANGNILTSNKVDFNSQITFKAVPINGYEIIENWSDDFKVSMNEDGSANVVFTVPANDVNFTIPTTGKENVLIISGNRLENILAYDITDGQQPLEITNNKINIETGRKIKLIFFASLGYEMINSATFDSLDISFTSRLEDESLIVEIESLFKDSTIFVETKERKNDITISFDNIEIINVVVANGLHYSSISDLPSFESQTNSDFEFYVSYKHGYKYSSYETEDCTLSVEYQEEGSYQGFFKFVLSNIFKDETVILKSAFAKFKIELQTKSYDDTKNLVDVPENLAYVNDETSVEVDYQTNVMLTYSLASKYSFAGWSLDGENIISNENGYEYQVLDNQTIYAIFSTMKYSITFATYDFYTIYDEYNNPDKTEVVFTEISDGVFVDENVQIHGLEIYFGSSKQITFQVPKGYAYYGFGYQLENQFVYLHQEERIEESVVINLATSEFSNAPSTLKIYAVVKSYSVNIDFETKIDIDGTREEDVDVGFIQLQDYQGNSVNQYGYVDGTRIHYSQQDFVSGNLLSNKKFRVVAYTNDVVYIRVEIRKIGYKFLNLVANNPAINIQKFDESPEYYVYAISNLVGKIEGLYIEVLYKPQLNDVKLEFKSENQRVDGGAFAIKAGENSSNKIWTSGRDYSSLSVSAYTDSSFYVYAQIRAGYYVVEDKLEITDESGLIVSDSLSYTVLSIVDTGYSGLIVFKVEGYLNVNSITINIKRTAYTVNLKEEDNLIATIKNVEFDALLNLSQTNSENIEVLDERISYVNGYLGLVMKKTNYNFEGYFTYQNGAGVRYIDSNGQAENSWKESGYIFNSLTSKYQLADNAKINNQTGEIEISLYLYWSYLKTRINFEFEPAINTNYTAKDMVEGVDHTNSWFYNTAPNYIEVAFNTDIHIVAPEIEGYKFYKFVVSQKNSEGVWLSDVSSYSNNIPWSTNEFDRIVECRIRIVYFVQIQVTIFGGEASYKISQDDSDVQAKILLQEGFVDSSKVFTIEAIEGEGYQFVRWTNTSTNESTFSKTWTMIANKKTNLVLSAQGLPVDLTFDYNYSHGQISTITTRSLDLISKTYQMGRFVENEFVVMLDRVEARVGDKIIFMLNIDQGFGVEWNRKDISFVEYKEGIYYFEMTILKDFADTTLQIVPTFKDEIVSIYISRDFAEDQKFENAMDLNSINLAGHTSYNGIKTDFVSVAHGVDIKIATTTNQRYQISKIVIINYGVVFDNIEDFVDSEGNIYLSKEYLEKNKIGGIVQIDIEYSRLLWEDVVVEANGFEGQGTEKNPYQIKSVEDIVLMMQFANSGRFATNGVRYKDSAFVLMADLNLKDKFWTPIGTQQFVFNGIFDFNGHTISGIANALIYSKTSHGGLFGVLGSGAKIITSRSSTWQIYVIGGVSVFLVMLIVAIIVTTHKRKRRRQELSKK